MTTTGVTPATTFFWLATFQWPTPTGIGTATLQSTFDMVGPLTRTKALAHIKQIAVREGVPGNAFVVFLTVEPDLIAVPAVLS